MFCLISSTVFFNSSVFSFISLACNFSSVIAVMFWISVILQPWLYWNCTLFLFQLVFPRILRVFLLLSVLPRRNYGYGRCFVSVNIIQGIAESNLWCWCCPDPFYIRLGWFDIMLRPTPQIKSSWMSLSFLDHPASVTFSPSISGWCDVYSVFPFRKLPESFWPLFWCEHRVSVCGICF